MKLPNAHIGFVEPEKITGYLLNSTHRYGASKARFFTRFGFGTATLAEALLMHARQHDFVRIRETPFGPCYEVEGELPAPDGRAPRIRTVWQVDAGEIAPRLITAYPLDHEDS